MTRFAPRFQLEAVVMVDTRTPPSVATADAAPEAARTLRLHTAAHALDVAHALQVKLSYPGQGGEKNTVKPGQPVEITIRTTDAQGRGVPAEVSLALVEEAARTQLPAPPPVAMPEFFRRRRASALRADWFEYRVCVPPGHDTDRPTAFGRASSHRRAATGSP